MDVTGSAVGLMVVGLLPGAYLGVASGGFLGMLLSGQWAGPWHPGLLLNCSREQVKLGHRPPSVTTVGPEVIRPITGGVYGHSFCLVPLMGPWRVKVALEYGRAGLKLGHSTTSRTAVRFEVGGPVTRGTYRHCFCHIPGMDP